MSVTEQLAARVARLEEQVHQLLVRALVTQIDAANYMVRVKYPAQDNVESGWLQVLTVKSHKDKYFALPDIDEQVLVLHLPGAQDVGYVLCTAYSALNPVPAGADSEDITMVNWGDGTWFKHDRGSGDVEMHITGNLTLAVGGNIDIGSGGKISISAADCIDVEAPNHITLGDADTININAKTDTKVVGGQNVYLVGTTLVKMQSNESVIVDSFGTIAVSSLAHLGITCQTGNIEQWAMTGVKIHSDTLVSVTAKEKVDLYSDKTLSLYSLEDMKFYSERNIHWHSLWDSYITADFTLAMNSKEAMQIHSDMTVGVGATATLMLGAATVMTSGVNLVSIPEVVSSCPMPVPGMDAEIAVKPGESLMKPPLPPGVSAASLPPYTVAAPQPIEPSPYVFDPPPEMGSAPDDPGPGAGPVSKPLIKEG